MKYIIKEVQNSHTRFMSNKYEGTLRGAKATATRWQAWEGTTLRIETENGYPVAYKYWGGKWEDVG